MKKRPLTSDTLVKNLNYLMGEIGMDRAELAKKSGVSPRMVAYILTGERVPSIDIAGALAGAFGLTGWQLIAPFDLEQSGDVEKLVNNFCKATSEGRHYISHVAEKEAAYKVGK